MSLIFNQTSSGSKSWISLCSSLDGQYVAALDNTTSTYGVYISNDHGTNWTSITNGLGLQSTNNTWVSICCSRDFQKIAALRTSGNIYISQDYGTSWTLKSLPSGIVIPTLPSAYTNHNNYNGFEICGSSTLSVIYAIVYQPYYFNPNLNTTNIILVSTDSGTTWTTKTFTISDGYTNTILATSICCNNDGTKLCIGNQAAYWMVTSTDYGNTFSENQNITGTVIRCDDSFQKFITLTIDIYGYGGAKIDKYINGTWTNTLMNNLSTISYDTIYKLTIATNPDFTKLAFVVDSGSSISLNYSTNSGQTFTNFVYNFSSLSINNNGIYGVDRNTTIIWNGSITDIGSKFLINGIDCMPPVGSIIAHTGTTSPNGWLICDGSQISRITYSILFSIIGTKYGVGNNTTTFNLPDLRGCLVRGASSISSLPASKLGTATVTLTESNLPAHTHTYQDVYFCEASSYTSLNVEGSNDSNYSNQFYYRTTTGSYTGDVTNSATNISTTGTTNGTSNATSTPISIIPNSLIINYIIKI